MTPEKDRELRQRYPLVFAGRLLNDEPIRCNDGWFDLLSVLCQQLNQLIEHEDPEARHRYRVVTVKEKFGGLRFYLDGRPTDAMQVLIDAAERLSTQTCDICGKRGRLLTVQDKLVATRCPEHEKVTWRDLIARGEQ